MSKIVEVNQLSVFYENHQAIKNVSFAVETPSLVGIIGPNGAGFSKSNSRLRKI